jgi:hypothetical protein
MKILIVGVFTAGAVLFSSLSSAAAPYIISKVQDNNLIVMIVNGTSSAIKINRRFGLGLVIGEIGLTFLSGNTKHELAIQPNINLAEEKDYLIIHPSQITGVAYDIDFIKGMFNIPAGCYDLVVTYKDGEAQKFGAFQGAITSNATKTCLN